VGAIRAELELEAEEELANGNVDSETGEGAFYAKMKQGLNFSMMNMAAKE